MLIVPDRNELDRYISSIGMIEGSFDLDQHLSDANVVESEIDRRLKNID